MWITFELGQKISLRKISINKFHLSTHGPPHMASPPTVLKKSGSLGKRENAKESSVFSLKQRQHPVWRKHCCAYQVRQKVKVKVAQSCLTLRDPVDCTVYGILQARILEWVAIPFSRGSSQPRDRTQVSHISGGFFASWATRGAQEYCSGWPLSSF